MTDFPLHIFLASLNPDGILLSARDYERLLILFQTRGPWTLTRLKNTLVAVLAKDEDQQRLIDRRFDKFFKARDSEKMFSEDEIKRALAGLRKIKPRELEPPFEAEEQTVSPEPETRPPEFEKPGQRFPWRIMVGIALIMAGIVAVWHFLPTPQPEIPTLELRPKAIDFGPVEIGQSVTKTLMVVNSGETPIVIDAMRVTGEFEAPIPELPVTLAPNQEHALSVGFAPASEGPFAGNLRISYGEAKHEAVVTLQGIGKLPVEKPKTPADTPEKPGPPKERKRLYKDVPYVQRVSHTPLPIPEAWRGVALAGVLFLFAIGYGVYLWRLHCGPKDKPPKIDPKKPMFFHSSVIGGKPEPWLDDATLADLADSMGYFKSDVPGKVLDVRESVRATFHQGGIPTCVFHARTRIRTLLILEDAHARATDWNPVSKELAAGMKRYGVPVVYGRFHGSPEVFTTPDGISRNLEDFEDKRRGILALLFTDGKCFHRPKNVFALESFSRWPMKAWMELREERFWDATLRLPIQHGIPVFPATKHGIVSAVRHFLTEKGTRITSDDNRIQGNRFYDFANLDDRVAHMLGETLPWAQDCAMMQPAIPEPLAHALRREFYPGLTPEKIDCLHALPNTVRAVSGLRFSPAVLKILRQGFLKRPIEHRRAVARFILDRITDAKPQNTDEDSLAFLTWQAVHERVRLEAGLDEDDEFKAFGRLMQSPLAGYFQDSLAHFSYEDQPGKIPMLQLPRNQKARQRLGRIKSLGLRSVSRLQFAFFVFCLLLAVAFVVFGLSLSYYIKALNERPNIRISGDTSAPARLYMEHYGIDRLADYDLDKMVENAGWKAYRSLDSVKELERDGLPANRNYRLILYGSGYRTMHEFEVRENMRTELVLARENIERRCADDQAEIGLEIKCCGDGSLGKTWKDVLGDMAPQNREMSIGIELSHTGTDTGELENFRTLLMATRSLDVMYRLSPVAGEWRLTEGMDVIRADLWPYLARSQLVCWSTGGAPELPAEMISEFQRGVRLATGRDVTWAEKMMRLLAPGQNKLITEAEIRAALPSPVFVGTGPEIVLIRPALNDLDGKIEIPATGSLPSNPKAGDQWSEPQTGMIFVYVPGGSFEMGCGGEWAGNCYSNEKPAHKVTLDGFWMGRYEVTQAQWEKVMKENPSLFKGDNLPVVNVAWNDASDFIKKLAEMNNGKFEFALPTEAQWEYSCRSGGKEEKYAGGNDLDLLGWCNRNSVGKMHEVGLLIPNGFGIYDMSGNVCEWCQDWYGKYGLKPENNPTGPSSGASRVCRGGSWEDRTRSCRSAYRYFYLPDYRSANTGFRLVLLPAITGGGGEGA